MAIKSRKLTAPTPTVAKYGATLRRRMTAVVVFVGVLVALFVAIVLISSEILPADSPVTWLLSTAIGAVSAASNMAAISLISQPFNSLLRAVAHVAGEPLAGPVPNPNDKKYARSGLSTAIRTVYAEADAKPGHAGEDKNSKYSLLSSSVNRMRGAVMALDTDHNVVYASRQAPTQTINGALRPQLLFHGDDTLDTWISECQESAVKAEHSWQRIPNRPSDAENQRIFDVYASYEKGATYETIVTVVDMTDRYQEDEESLNFIAFAAHELRGPITVIRGYLDVLQDELDTVLADDQRELFHRLSVSANRLTSYVNNILNTSRYDRRHLNMSLAPTHLADVYAVIHDDMALRASSQNRLLTVSIPQGLPQIAADAASLSEVISNLIDNAIKYSNEGGAVTVTAELSGEFVNINVQDHGIGMSGSVVKNLFQKFYRSHRSRETVAGSGIGLYISKAIVESHGGTISVRSTEGRGSTFIVSIPTYASVADKLATDGSNQNLISQGRGWIKNHSMYRG